MFQVEGKLGTKLANGDRPLIATKQLNKEHHCLHIERRKSHEKTGVFDHENVRNKQSETKSPTSFTSVKASVSLQKKHKIAPKKWSVKMSLTTSLILQFENYVVLFVDSMIDGGRLSEAVLHVLSDLGNIFYSYRWN